MTNDVGRPPGVPPPLPAEGRTAETTAAHIGSSPMWETRAAFRQCMERVPELYRLAHYTQCDWDFSVGPQAEVDLDTIGANLVAALTRLSHLLAPAGTGALIRTVAHAARGALVCNTIMQGEWVVGVVLAEEARQSLRHESTRRADRAVSRLVTDVRHSFGQQGQNPGGFGTAGPDLIAWEPTPDAALDLEARIDSVLGPRDLQFVAVVHEGTIVLTRDIFDDPEAAVFFRAGYTPAVRREFYAKFLLGLEQHARDIAVIVNAAIGRGLRRLVLDVQRGAIYYYRIDLHNYLVGITLNQDEVPLGDLKTEWLCESLAQSVS